MKRYRAHTELSTNASTQSFVAFLRPSLSLLPLYIFSILYLSRVTSINMEARFLLQSRSSFPVSGRRKHELRQPHPVLCTMTKPAGEFDTAAPNLKTATVYRDKWFDHWAINHLSQNVQAVSGLRSNKKGFDNLVEAARMVLQQFDPVQQREIVKQALDKAIPAPILTLIRTLVPNSEFKRQYFAVFTTIFFKWLVGPCEVRESELNGRIERNVVYIPKCRLLEESNCVGMCTNMCKMPSQAFIKDSLGVPITMVPNFDDMSCEMIFGREPPSASEDPAFKQPCYKLCKTPQRHSTNCTS